MKCITWKKWNRIWHGRYTDACCNMDEHRKYYAELMKPAIGSGEDNETTSKEIQSCWTWWFIMKKPQGHMTQIVTVQTINY